MEERIDVEDAYWLKLIGHSPLAILTDLDGALIPIAARPDDARPSPQLVGLVDELAALPGVMFIIVSGRPRESLDGFFPAPRSVVLFAEHGAWRRAPGGWEPFVAADAESIEALYRELRRVSAKVPNVVIERKTWSVAVHFRSVSESDRSILLVEVSAAIEPWLDAHGDFEPLWGSEVLEVRPRTARKSNAVSWARSQLGEGARLVIVGDDTTDEDMFAAASENDATVLVTTEPGRATTARWRLDSTEDAHSFYREILAQRRGANDRAPGSRVRATVRTSLAPPAFRLLVVSNRLPELRSAEAPTAARTKNVGGLVSALKPVLEAREGVWLGWSGRTRSGREVGKVGQTVAQGIALAALDFPEEWHRHYYNGFSNGALWPLLHSFPGRVRFTTADWQSYEQANAAFATMAMRLVGSDSTVWVHDYHLMLMGRDLRSRGHTGRIGFFQHVPFPGPDIFSILPWAKQVLAAMLDFDLIGFHTQPYVENFLRCAATVPGVTVEGDHVVFGTRRARVAAFPIGIMPEDFASPDATASEEIGGLLRIIGNNPMVLGVDRLDYTKGIPERIDAFGRLLELYPEYRRRVYLVQVSVPSRADVREYAEQRTRVENSVGRINGEYGTADWMPIRYLYRSYGRAELAQLYRAAAVGYVTPLRDGMNLVAKEYVAAQNPESPGVLLLSEFAGAAEELRDAVLTNPWYPEGIARDLDRALRMPLDERKQRHTSLRAAVSRTTALSWAEDFLAALERPS